MGISEKKSTPLLEFVIPREVNGGLGGVVKSSEEKKLIYIEAEYNRSISWPVWLVPVV